MSPHKYLLTFFLLLPNTAHAVTLTSGQTDYTTTYDITNSGVGISSSLTGSSSSLNKITNLHTITTGNSGSTSSAYGIKTTNNYNQITNGSSGVIITTGSSGRGISISNFSIIYNLGNITTQGATSYGLYAGGDNNAVNNSGSIATSNTTAYGIYLNGDNNSASNSGTISTQVYGIYGEGNVNQITNSGTINTAISSSAHGIYVSAASSSTASASSYNTVNNSGTINSSGNGIYNKDAYTDITNSGSITTSSSAIYGIRNEGNNSVITNSGSISSPNYAIYNSGTNATINNSGNVSGGIYIGNGTLNILGGTISGSVDGKSAAGSTNIGSDSINTTFNQTASFTDLNSLIIKSGSTLNSYNSITANTISLDENATLTINEGSSINTAITGVSSSSGILNIIGTSFAPSVSIGTSSNMLDNLNINSGSSFTASSDIYVADILVNNGNLNLDQTNNLTIFGNLSGGGLGTVNIASNNQTVSGNFTLSSGDTLAVEFNNGEIGNLTIDGITNIDSNAKLSITTSSNQNYITNGSNFTILNAASGSTINAINNSNITLNGVNSNSSGLLTFTTNAISNSLIITINRLQANQITSNQNVQNIYKTINDIGATATGELSQFQSYLDNSNLSKAEITETINQLAPQSTKAMLANNINIISNSIKPIDSRLDKLHQISNDDFENGLWMQAFGSSATQDAVKDDEGYKINSLGFVLASDQKTDDETTVGAALSYMKSNIKSANNLKTNLVSTYQINFYGGQNFDKYFLDSLVGFSWSQYSSSRSIAAVDSNTNASYNGQIYNAKIKTGFVEKLSDELNLTPEISLNFIRSNIDGYSEKGSDSLNLKVESISANFFESRAGINLGWITKFEELPEFNKISSNFKISYGYSLINDAPITNISFAKQDNNFTSKISQTDRTSIKIGTEIIAYHIDNLTFSTDYVFEKKATYQSHFLSLKMRQEF